jgi:hypothetical protein
MLFVPPSQEGPGEGMPSRPWCAADLCSEAALFQLARVNPSRSFGAINADAGSSGRRRRKGRLRRPDCRAGRQQEGSDCGADFNEIADTKGPSAAEAVCNTWIVDI